MELAPLFAELREMYRDQPVGVKARVEQEIAAIREEISQRGLPITRRGMEAYGLGLVMVGMDRGVSPDTPTFEADWLGNRMMAAALLHEEAASP